MFRPAVKTLLVLTGHHWLTCSQPPQTKHTTYQVRGRETLQIQAPPCSWYATQAVARSARPDPIRPPIGCCSADVTPQRQTFVWIRLPLCLCRFRSCAAFQPRCFGSVHVTFTDRGRCGTPGSDEWKTTSFIHFQWYKSRWVQWSEWCTLFL